MRENERDDGEERELGVCEIVCLPPPTREKGGEKGLYSHQEGCVWDVAALGGG